MRSLEPSHIFLIRNPLMLLIETSQRMSSKSDKLARGCFVMFNGAVVTPVVQRQIVCC